MKLEQTERRHVLRFDATARLTHALLASSFLGLSLTGLPILFSDAGWARAMSAVFGGYGVTGILHRFFGVLLLTVFLAHVAWLVYRVYAKKDYGLLWGPAAIVPTPQDAVQMYQHFRWFVGKGPRPKFDRFTYWQKFDYWAVFWGMGIIGTSGLMLWFPKLFATFLPGWVFNVAFLVHGHEALLAMVFIFTVHFFNENLRPEKFPMDTVMFTGRMTLEEWKHEHPAEHARHEEAGTLAEFLADEGSAKALRWGRVLGTLGIALGLLMVGLTINALLAR